VAPWSVQEALPGEPVAVRSRACRACLPAVGILLWARPWGVEPPGVWWRHGGGAGVRVGQVTTGHCASVHGVGCGGAVVIAGGSSRLRVNSRCLAAARGGVSIYV
jgi:hypothetical protein